jgi:two-component system NtrC family sensor kinase
VERALADAQQQVVVAERRAAIGQVAVAISHEMNNPLMALRTQLELLKMDVAQLPDAVRKNVDDAIAQVDRIAAVVKRVAEHEHQAAVTYVGKTKMIDLSTPPA